MSDRRLPCPATAPPRFRLLGDVASTGVGGDAAVLRGAQPRTVLALLLLERHRTVSRFEIADQLWADELPSHWQGAVRGVVSKVRSHLSRVGLAETLHSTGNGWRIVLDGATDDVAGPVDVERARALVQLGETVVRAEDRTSDESLVVELLEQVMLLGDELAPGASGERIEQRRREVEHLHRQGLAAVVDLAGRAGRADLEVRAATSLVDLDPYSEPATRALVQALARSGDRRAAIDAGHEFTRRLADALGVRPEPETVELIARVTGERRATERRGVRLPSPSPLQQGAPPIIGRDREIQVMRQAWDEVVNGAGARCVLLVGEAGAGKTRLAWEVTSVTGCGTDEGVVVLWGRCSPDRRVSYEPVIEAFSRAIDDGRIGPSTTGPLGAEVSQLLPTASEPADTAPDRAAAFDRSRLFHDMGSLLRAVADLPTVWVVDDLHWANADTLALLTHLVSISADLPVLVVMTSRHTDGEVASTLESTARAIPTHTVGLQGLDAADVGRLLAAVGIRDASVLRDDVHARTGGNPLFIRELIRTADADGHLDPSSLPDTLRSWITSRVAALPRAAADLLGAASVIGPRIDVAVLAGVVGRDVSAVVADLDPLLVAGLLVEPADGADLAFAHALTRQAVLDDLTGIRRHHLHAATAEALRRLRAGSPSDVAYHLASAGSDLDAWAVPAMIEAGDAALTAMAWSTAKQWFTDVLDRRTVRGSERIDALIGLGTALRGSGDRVGARAALDEALDASTHLGDRRRVARAALGLLGGGARGVCETLGDAERAAVLSDALDGLGADDDDLRIPLQLELALALLLTDQVERRRDLADDALARARTLGQLDLLGRALVGHRLARHGPDGSERRLEEVDEVLSIDPRHRSHDVTLSALMSRHEDALLIGDRGLAIAALDEACIEVGRSGHPYWLWVVRTWQVLGCIIDGDLEQAEATAFEALGHQADHPEATACLGVQLVDIRLFQGRADEVVDLLGAASADNPHIPTYRAVLALCLAESGDHAGAAAALRSFGRSGFAEIPEDTNRLLGLAVLADVAATVGHEPSAQRLGELLEPHAHRQVVLNCFAGGGAYWGPVATQLGRLAALTGDDEAAARHFAAARRSTAAFASPLAAARIPSAP